MYPANAQITWLIRVAVDNFIQLEFIDFYVESSLRECNQDFIELYNVLRDGGKGFMGRYCQANPPPTNLMSGMNEMSITFSSDMYYSNSGFLGYYSSQSYRLSQDLLDKLNNTGVYL